MFSTNSLSDGRCVHIRRTDDGEWIQNGDLQTYGVIARKDRKTVWRMQDTSTPTPALLLPQNINGVPALRPGNQHPQVIPQVNNGTTSAGIGRTSRMQCVLFFLLVVLLALCMAHFPVYSVYGGEGRKPMDVFRMLADMRNKVDKKNYWANYDDY